jgi:hypothetical protein
MECLEGQKGKEKWCNYIIVSKNKGTTVYLSHTPPPPLTSSYTSQVLQGTSLSHWLSEHSTRMEFCEKISYCLWEDSYDLSFFKIQNYSWTVCSCPSQAYWKGVSSLQIIHYNWLMLLLYMPLWENMIVWSAAYLPCVACPYDCTCYPCESS